jgi:hypothetical protein
MTSAGDASSHDAEHRLVLDVQRRYIGQLLGNGSRHFSSTRSGSATASADQRFDERGVEVYRSGRAALPRRGPPEPIGHRSPRDRHLGARHTGLFEETNHRSVEMSCSMTCGAPTPCSSGGTIGREHDQGHEREIGLGDARVQFRRRRAAGHHDRDGPLAHERPTEGEESGAALVESNVQGELGAGGRGEASGVEREPGERTTSRRPEVNPLVKERRRERRLGLAGARYAT